MPLTLIINNKEFQPICTSKGPAKTIAKSTPTSTQILGYNKISIGNSPMIITWTRILGEIFRIGIRYSRNWDSNIRFWKIYRFRIVSMSMWGNMKVMRKVDFQSHRNCRARCIPREATRINRVSWGYQSKAQKISKACTLRKSSSRLL